jgi:hypothetical protein
MRLGRKINHGFRLISECVQNRVPVSDVAFDETMAILVDPSEVIEISSVGERVEICDLARGKIIEEVSNKSRPDKSGSACNKKFIYSIGHDYLASWLSAGKVITTLPGVNRNDTGHVLIQEVNAAGYVGNE